MGKHMCAGCIHEELAKEQGGKWFKYCTRFHTKSLERRKACCNGEFYQKA